MEDNKKDILSVSCGVITQKGLAPRYNSSYPGTYLMVQSGEGPYKGKWGSPGGKLQFGETPNETLVREIEEETGYKVGNLELFGIYCAEPLPGLWVVTHAYRGGVIDGDMKELDGKEIVDIAWMSYRDIENLPGDKIRTVNTLSIIKDSCTMHGITDLERKVIDGL